MQSNKVIDENYLQIESLKYENKILCNNVNNLKETYSNDLYNIELMINVLCQSVNNLMINYQNIKHKFTNNINQELISFKRTNERMDYILNLLYTIDTKIKSIDLLFMTNASKEKTCQTDSFVEKYNQSSQFEKNLTTTYYKQYEFVPKTQKSNLGRLSLIERNSSNFMKNNRMDYACLDSNCVPIPVIFPNSQGHRVTDLQNTEDIYDSCSNFEDNSNFDKSNEISKVEVNKTDDSNNFIDIKNSSKIKEKKVESVKKKTRIKLKKTK